MALALLHFASINTRSKMQMSRNICRGKVSRQIVPFTQLLILVVAKLPSQPPVLSEAVGYS